MSYTCTQANAELTEFEQAATDTLARLREHIEQAIKGGEPATGYASLRVILDDLDVEHWINQGGMDPSSFDEFLRKYLTYSVQFHNPRYIAHQVSVPDYPAALGGMINGLTNNPMAIYEMGPAAATMEFAVLNWMLRKIGWPGQTLPGDSPVPGAAGVLTHGGSLANLTALLAARARASPEAWQHGTPDDLAILVPPTSHYSVARAVSILGLGAKSVYHVDVTELGVIQPEHLDRALARVRAEGKRCMALVANACATATGLHDPLRPIGEFCNANNIWLHADACHGATALLSKQSRHYLDGIELADSVVWDTHKMMQVPILCAAVLLKDGSDFDRAFHQEASYLAYGADNESYDALPRAVECTKAALSLKIFLNLAWRGERVLGEYVDDRYAITRQFYNQIYRRAGFECLCEPESNILCFRYGQDDELQQRIRDTLVHERRFHLSSALVNGKRYLRMTVMNKLTDKETINEMLGEIELTAARLAQ